MLVKMTTSTLYGKPLIAGDEVNVPEAVAKRWEKAKIAIIIEQPKEEKTVEEMTAKELFELCVEKGFEVEPKKSKAYYLEFLKEEAE